MRIESIKWVNLIELVDDPLSVISFPTLMVSLVLS